MNIQRNTQWKEWKGNWAELINITHEKSNFFVSITNFGATIVQVQIPDRDGNRQDVNLARNNPEEYASCPAYFGCSVGRVAGRIRSGEFTLKNNHYQLARNNGNHCLHGGVEGFNVKLWSVRDCKVEITEEGSENSVIMMDYVSSDGEEGFPGTLITQIEFRVRVEEITDGRWKWYLTWEFTANVKDKVTIINLTNHSYWNLDGLPKHTDQLETIDKQIVTLHVDSFMPVDQDCLVTGEIVPMSKSPIDFSIPHTFQEIFSTFGDVDCGFFIHNRPSTLNGKDLRRAATVESKATGITMFVDTSEPCVQVYTANFLDPQTTVFQGIKTQKHSAVCLETQRPANAINIPQFADWVTLEPSQTYHHKTQHTFFHQSANNN